MEKNILFRQNPPFSVILDVFRLLKLSTTFPVSFVKDDICIDNSDEAVATLYGYYKPCKAAQFLDSITQVGWVTVLRQCLKIHGYILHRQETTRHRKKTIIYTIDKNTDTLDTPVLIDFS